MDTISNQQVLFPTNAIICPLPNEEEAGDIGPPSGTRTLLHFRQMENTKEHDPGAAAYEFEWQMC